MFAWAPPCSAPPCVCCRSTTGKRGKGKKAGGRQDKPLVVISELPYQTNKASSWTGFS